MKKEIYRLNESEKSSRIGYLNLLGIVVAATVIASVVSVWVMQKYMFPDEFEPVMLTVKEEKTLDTKIERLESITDKRQSSGSGEVPLEPERYHEDLVVRRIVFSEKELNALLAKNTDLAEKLAIDLSNGMASAKLLLPLDEEFPVLGGRTLKVTAGLGIDYLNGKPVIMIKGISIWGVPIPNAWMGNMKNVDLVKEFGAEKGFWKSFADGIDKIEIKEKSLLISLRE
ncbi:MAG: arginine N-succinyltransferase [Desulfobacteraceae bacterium]|nr:arginine N-succinyltransferase [Desulfobacteraceae bacterium]MBC2756858.1 arginine N-succinyltransferase [Desulfobacteraceae bacterium]